MSRRPTTEERALLLATIVRLLVVGAFVHARFGSDDGEPAAIDQLRNDEPDYVVRAYAWRESGFDVAFADAFLVGVLALELAAQAFVFLPNLRFVVPVWHLPALMTLATVSMQRQRRPVSPRPVDVRRAGGPSPSGPPR